MDTEALEEQWADLVQIGEFVADELVSQAMEASKDRQKALLDGARGVQATIRQARKVQATLGWKVEGEIDG